MVKVRFMEMVKIKMLFQGQQYMLTQEHNSAKSGRAHVIWCEKLLPMNQCMSEQKTIIILKLVQIQLNH